MATNIDTFYHMREIISSSGGDVGASGLGVGGNATASKLYSTSTTYNTDAGEEHGGVSY
jgi:hypothetical protein